MEDTVKRYFQGVNEKNPNMIRSCFADEATIRDVCGISDQKRTVQADALVERCMEFVTAHPDCLVQFHYGPECGRNLDWVVAHWYETGTWSGESCGVPPNNQPMAVEGQTRFRLVEKTASSSGDDAEDNDADHEYGKGNPYKIQEFVVTRTFTEWENAMLAKKKADEK